MEGNNHRHCKGVQHLPQTGGFEEGGRVGGGNVLDKSSRVPAQRENAPGGECYNSFDLYDPLFKIQCMSIYNNM